MVFAQTELHPDTLFDNKKLIDTGIGKVYNPTLEVKAMEDSCGRSHIRKMNNLYHSTGLQRFRFYR